MKNKKLIIGIVIGLVVVVGAVVLLLNKDNLSKNPYLDITEKGCVSINPSYVDVKAFSGRDRLSKDQISEIKKNAKEMNITPEQYVFLCFMKSNETKNVFKSIDEAKKYQKELETAYQWTIKEVYDDYLTKSPDWDLIVKAILSVDKTADLPAELKIPNKVNGIEVKAIADYGFCYTKLQTVTMPNTVKEVGSYAFNSCYSLKKVNVSDGIKKVGDSAFLNCVKLKVIDSAGLDIDWGDVKVSDHNDDLIRLISANK